MYADLSKLVDIFLSCSFFRPLPLHFDFCMYIYSSYMHFCTPLPTRSRFLSVFRHLSPSSWLIYSRMDDTSRPAIESSPLFLTFLSSSSSVFVTIDYAPLLSFSFPPFPPPPRSIPPILFPRLSSGFSYNFAARIPQFPFPFHIFILLTPHSCILLSLLPFASPLPCLFGSITPCRISLTLNILLILVVLSSLCLCLSRYPSLTRFYRFCNNIFRRV